MCEQTEVRHLEGDIVWVKLGSCWWPGKVRDVDKLPEEVLESFRKKPIAAVQFFEEDKFEYVKNLDQICIYNCRRKNEFIKKGLDMYRSRQREGSSFMDKFPKDVSMAEQLTGGNPNIITDNEFAPEEKPNYSNIFGGEKKAKPVTPPTSKVNGRRHTPMTSPMVSPRTITHPRILKALTGEGNDDHEVRIRQQPRTPVSKDSTPDVNRYNCYKCSFTTSRLNVIVAHSKIHSSEKTASTSNSITVRGSSRSPGGPDTPKGRGRPRVTPVSSGEQPKSRNRTVPPSPVEIPETPKSTAPSQSRLSADIDRVSKEECLKDVSSTPEKKAQKMPIFGKRKGVKGGSEKTVKKKKVNEDFREKLLADWGDEDPEEEEKEIEILKKELQRSESLTDVRANDSSTATSDPIASKAKEFSCFDFDEKADAILDSELEERAKKFAETRNVHRFTEDKIDMGIKREIGLKPRSIEPIPGSSVIVESVHSRKFTKSHPKETVMSEVKIESDKDIELNDVFKTIMTETALPSLPQVPQAKPKARESSNSSEDAMEMDTEGSSIGESDHNYVTRHVREKIEVPEQSVRRPVLLERRPRAGVKNVVVATQSIPIRHDISIKHGSIVESSKMYDEASSEMAVPVRQTLRSPVISETQPLQLSTRVSADETTSKISNLSESQPAQVSSISEPQPMQVSSISEKEATSVAETTAEQITSRSENEAADVFNISESSSTHNFEITDKQDIDRHKSDELDTPMPSVSDISAERSKLSDSPIEAACISGTPTEVSYISGTSTDTAYISGTPTDTACISSTLRKTCISNAPMGAECISDTPEETACISDRPIDTACLSEVPVETAFISGKFTEAPCISEKPMETCTSDTPTEATCMSDTSTDMAYVSDKPTETAFISDTPKEVACISDTPIETACTSDTPTETACTSDTPTETPYISDTPTETAFKSEAPVETAYVPVTPTEICMSDMSTEMACMSGTSTVMECLSDTQTETVCISDTPIETVSVCDNPPEVAYMSDTLADMSGMCDTPTTECSSKSNISIEEMNMSVSDTPVTEISCTSDTSAAEMQYAANTPTSVICISDTPMSQISSESDALTAHSSVISGEHPRQILNVSDALDMNISSRLIHEPTTTVMCIETHETLSNSETIPDTQTPSVPQPMEDTISCSQPETFAVSSHTTEEAILADTYAVDTQAETLASEIVSNIQTIPVIQSLQPTEPLTEPHTFSSVHYMSEVLSTPSAVAVTQQSAAAMPSTVSFTSVQSTASILDDETELDINSMPVVMGDAVITDEVSPPVQVTRIPELTTKSTSVVKVLKPPAPQAIRFHTSSMKTSDGATLISPKGGSGSKYVLIQPSSSGQQTLYKSGKGMQQCLTLKTMPQQSGQKLVLVQSPQQEGILSSTRKIGIPQHIITTQGILKPLTSKSIVSRGGTKLMTLTPEQMKAFTSKQNIGSKFTVQRTPTKVMLPSMQNIQKVPISQPSTVKLIGATSMRPKSNTILIQTTQGTAVAGSYLSKTPAPSTNMQVQPKRTISQTIVRQTTPRPKLLTPAAGSSLQRVLMGSPGVNPNVRHKMVVQKIRTPAAPKQSGLTLLPTKKVSAVYQRSQLIPKSPQSQIIQKVTTTPSIQKIKHVEHKSVVQVPKPGPSLTDPLPSMQPLQPEITVAPTIQHGVPEPTTLLAPQQLAQVMVSAPGDQATATYVLVTIDESGQLMQDSGARTLYLDRASGDLDNLLLTVNNPSSSQDILAAALANTDVFQPEPISDNLTVVNSNPAPLSAATLHQATMLLPSLSSVLPPVSAAGGVLETSLTLKQPIMTPLEVPSATCSLQPPPMSTSLELPLTIPSASYTPLSLHLAESNSSLSLHLSESSSVSSSTLHHTIAKPVSAFHPSMPLLSEDSVDSAPPSSSLDLPQNQSEPTPSVIASYEQISASSAPTPSGTLPLFAQVPDISSRVIYQTPESTSEAATVETSETSDQTVSTSRTQVPEEYSEIIDSSLNRPTSNEPSPPSYSITVENTSEAMAIKDPVSEAQDSSSYEVAPDQGVRIPYDRVESTSQLLENDSLNTAVQPPSDTTNLQSYSETPESTSSIPEEVIQDKSSSEVLESQFGYCVAPESSCIPESSSQVPESTSQSMPLLSDEPGEHSGLKRCGSPLAHEMGLAKRMKHQGNERMKDQALSPRPLLSPALQEEENDSDDDSLPAFLPPIPTSDKKKFQKNDIVWMKIEKVYWPSVVTYVSKKLRKAKVKVVNSPRKEKAFVKKFGALVDFCNRDRNKRLLEEGRQQNIGVQKAFDNVITFMSERYAQKDLSAARFLTFDKDDILYGLIRKPSEGIPAISQEAVSSTTDRKCSESDSSDESFKELSDHSEESEESEDEELSPSKLLEMEEDEMYARSPSEFPTDEERAERDELARQVIEKVQEPACRRYLTAVFRGKAPSKRHELFINTGYTCKDSLKYMSGVGPVADSSMGCQLAAVLEGYLKRVDPKCKIENKGSRNDYIFYVWVPEAVIFALQHIQNIDKDAAIVMFKEMSALPS